jgi:hypothetical protein
MSNSLVKSNKNFSRYSRPLIASMLVSSGLLQLAAPVLADGTPAGTNISNTATASYEDPSDPTKPLNTVSNTVEVKVAEVAGVTVTADTFAILKGTGTAPGAEAGDTVNFDFTVTNVGNDPTRLRIPGTATLTGAGSVTKVQYFDTTVAGNVGGWNDIPNGSEYISGSKGINGTVKVRVVVAILSGAGANTNVSVTLGKTISPDQQNVVRNADGGDVFTVDNTVTGVVNEVYGTGVLGDDGIPENGVREASASQTLTIGATPQAFAAVTKVRGAQNTNGTANILTDDTLSYTLGLKVANQADVPSGSNKIAADLTATPIFLGSAAQNKVLVSDAVPVGTVAKTVTIPAALATAGWTAVYTTSATSLPATISGTPTAANAATWVAIPTPANGGILTVPTGATRVGFINDGEITKGTEIGTTSNPGFSIELGFTAAFAASGGTIANIAQVFGSTNIGTGTTITPDLTKPVYDESGDSNPNNTNDDGSVPATNPIGNGVAIAADPNPDSNNNNTGIGPNGEPNIYQVVPPGQAGILNGTADKPEAVGPTGNNDDFTNTSAPIPATTWVYNTTTKQYEPQAIDPASIAFANTFKLDGLATAPKKDVSLLPTVPTVASDLTNLQNGTVTTISFGATSKSYRYTGTKWVDFVGGVQLLTTTPLVIPQVTPGTKVNYGVEVDLPAGSEQLKGFGVPITTFVDTGTAGLDAADTQNTTIDRVYTGYLKLEKLARITDAAGGLIEDFTDKPKKKAAPGQLITYQITYTNISEAAPANSGSIALNAKNINVVEDGVPSATNQNNWAATTEHKAGSAVDSNNGTILFNNGSSNNSSPAVSVYKDTVNGPLTPQQSGTFTFTRIVK